jgi:hypothetical protein
MDKGENELVVKVRTAGVVAMAEAAGASGAAFSTGKRAMIYPFDIVREMARLVDAGKEGDDLVAEMLRKFPTITAADLQRVKLIGMERIALLEEERMAAARALADKWFGGAEERQPSAETLFPIPDKTKS